MAEELVDEVVDGVDVDAEPCTTSTIGLLGRDGWEPTLSVQLVQHGGVRAEVANHLASAYGGSAWDVLALARPHGKRYPRFGIPLAEGRPHVEAEVRYACREHAVTIEDILSRRTRLAFLNAEAARDAVPTVAEIMSEELGWSAEERAANSPTPTTTSNASAGRSRTRPRRSCGRRRTRTCARPSPASTPTARDMCPWTSCGARPSSSVFLWTIRTPNLGRWTRTATGRPPSRNSRRGGTRRRRAPQRQFAPRPGRQEADAKQYVGGVPRVTCNIAA